ncbi:MAG: 50S ribosomal protein L25 [Nitrospirae bacterium]|nr:50S ribosomal protein L25 [Nitrospirota bacterium]
MERITIEAEKRDTAGKGSARALRRGGIVPAVLYRDGKTQPIKISHKEMYQFLKTTSGKQVLVSLRFPDGIEKLALLKEYQIDPIKGKLLHTDFFEVALDKKIRTKVHVSVIGEPIGVKRDGGILQHSLREIEIECLPDKIPGHIETDISELLTGHSIHVSALRLPEDIKVLTDPNEVIATVTAPLVEAAPTPAEAVAAPAVEPEVIKKGKKEEEKAEEKA